MEFYTYEEFKKFIFVEDDIRFKVYLKHYIIVAYVEEK